MRGMNLSAPMKTFVQHVTDTLAETRRELRVTYPELDRESAQAHLYTIGEQAGRGWWRALEDAAYRGELVPLAAWRSALREHQSSARGLLGRWVRARPSDCPDALKAAAMAQEFGKA